MTDRVSATFAGKKIFISGGSGFVGKVLIEKLLRCTEVDTIYLLIRNKKGKTPKERISEIFDNPLYNQLKKERPETIKKCVAIAGDVSEIELGMSDEDRELITTQVDYIYHSAATTRFDNTIKFACQINVRGTKYMLNLASECKKLKLFMHVSTAYVHPEIPTLDEKMYPPPANPHEVLNSVEWLKEDDLKVTKALLGDCPNTYTFSKALAEGLIEEQMEKLPIVVCRPSVVIPIWLEPYPGWCNNLQGPMGLVAGAGKGVIRSMHADENAAADFIPVDVVVNGLMLVTWQYLTIDKQKRIFNLTTSSTIRMTWGEIIDKGRKVALHTVPLNPPLVWYPGGKLRKNKWAHEFAFYMYQLIPAILLDGLLMLLGYKPCLYQIQRRIQKGGEMFEYYTLRPWTFKNTNSVSLRAHMNSIEAKTYKCDEEGLDLDAYFINCMKGVRNVNLKESDETLPAARRNIKVMWALDFFCKHLLLFTFLYYCYKWFVAPYIQ